jgi:hypothetical protein
VTRRVIDSLDGPVALVALVGHSHGGAVITEAGTHEKRELRQGKHSPVWRGLFEALCVMGFGQGDARGQAWPGTGGVQGFPVNRACRTSRTSHPCLRAVSM